MTRIQNILCSDLGLIDYKVCWDMQESVFSGLVREKNMTSMSGKEATNDTIHDAIEGEAVAPTLFLCEHPHVYTLGKSGSESNMLIDPEFLTKVGAAFYKIDRGGDITYHGPGQLVGYPVIDIEKLGIGLKEYVHQLEQTIIETLAEFGIQGGRSEGATGVWLEPSGGKGLRKISAIGVRSSRFVTMHGFSLNVAPAMEYFTYINPCGFTDRGVTSMAQEMGNAPSVAEVKEMYKKFFEKTFNVCLVESDRAHRDNQQ